MPDQPSSESPYEFVPRTPAPGEPGSGGAAAPVEAPAEAELERLCPHCGFRIVGKPPRGRCPDCAAALDEVAADLLQFSDGAWLAGMSNGVWLLAGGIVTQVLAIVVGWLGEWAFGNVIHGVAGIAAAAGVWMATAPEPRAGEKRLPFALFARWSAVLVAALWTVGIIVGQGEPVEGKIDRLMIVTLAAMGVMSPLVALHLRSLATRVPNDSLAGQFFNIGFAGLGVCFLLAGLQSLDLANARYLTYFFCAFPMIGGMAVVVAWTGWTLIKMGFELRNCAAAGQAIVSRQALRAQAAAAKR